MANVKITAVDVAESVKSAAHILITQQETNSSGATTESLRRAALSSIVTALKTAGILDKTATEEDLKLYVKNITPNGTSLVVTDGNGNETEIALDMYSKSEVDEAISDAIEEIDTSDLLSKSKGGTMSADIDMGGEDITNAGNVIANKVITPKITTDDDTNIEISNTFETTMYSSVVDKIKLNSAGFDISGVSTASNGKIYTNQIKTSNSKITVNANDLEVNSAKSVDIAGNNNFTAAALGGYMSLSAGENTDLSGRNVIIKADEGSSIELQSGINIIGSSEEADINIKSGNINIETSGNNGDIQTISPYSEEANNASNCGTIRLALTNMDTADLENYRSSKIYIGKDNVVLGMLDGQDLDSGKNPAVTSSISNGIKVTKTNEGFYTEIVGDLKAENVSADNLEMSEPLTVENGGTGATTAAAARTNLGFGEAATKDVDETVTGDSENLPTSGAVYDALSNYALVAEAGYSLNLSIDESTYIMTLSLANKAGTVLSTKTIDFPLESMVVSADYSDGDITLTLQNGNTTSFSVADLVAGLVSESRTIAGLSLENDITAEELLAALGIEAGATNITVDTELDEDSDNAIANSAVAEAINNPSTASVVNALLNDFIIRLTAESISAKYIFMKVEPGIDYDIFKKLYYSGEFYIGTDGDVKIAYVDKVSKVAYDDGILPDSTEDNTMFLIVDTDNNMISYSYFQESSTSAASSKFAVGDIYELNFGSEGWETYLLSVFDLYTKEEVDELVSSVEMEEATEEEVLGMFNWEDGNTSNTASEEEVLSLFGWSGDSTE